jgi:hypothetical protein
MDVDRGQNMDDHDERTVGVFRWVLDSTISKKSAAVGTGAMAFRPLVDIGADEVQVDGQRSGCVWDQNFGFKDLPTVGDHSYTCILWFMESIQQR